MLTAKGVAPTGTIVGMTRGDGHVHYTRADKGGGFRFEHLTPGPWQVARCEPDDQQWLRTERSWPVYDPVEIPIDSTLREGNTTRFELDLSAEAPCSIEGLLSLGGGTRWRSTVTLRRAHDGRGNHEPQS